LLAGKSVSVCAGLTVNSRVLTEERFSRFNSGMLVDDFLVFFARAFEKNAAC
jgi:hypothetical protein